MTEVAAEAKADAERRWPMEQILEALRGLLKYALGEGQKDAESLGYIPLPQSTVEKVTAALDNVKGTES